MTGSGETRPAQLCAQGPGEASPAARFHDVEEPDPPTDQPSHGTAMLETVLGEWGYETVLACNGLAAAQLLHHKASVKATRQFFIAATGARGGRQQSPERDLGQ